MSMTDLKEEELDCAVSLDVKDEWHESAVSTCPTSMKDYTRDHKIWHYNETPALKKPLQTWDWISLFMKPYSYKRLHCLLTE